MTEVCLHGDGRTPAEERKVNIGEKGLAVLLENKHGKFVTQGRECVFLEWQVLPGRL